MSDRELLEAAARAAGMTILPEGRWPNNVDGWFYNEHGGVSGGLFYYGGRNQAVKRWNPLADDGDAFRLAVKLELEIRRDGSFKVNVMGNGCFEEEQATMGYTIEEATRRAIVRAAASLAQTLPKTGEKL